MPVRYRCMYEENRGERQHEVDTTHVRVGNSLVLEINGQARLAHVAATPFFDPDGARMNA